jgi:hypothetical protein
VEEETTNKKPDNVSDNPGLLPYGSNIGAPAIKLENIQTWKNTRVQNVNNQFENRLLELKKEYDNLIEEYKWNDLVYQSKFNFEPIINKIYHLYYSTNGSTFLSLVEPQEWNKEHIGSFRYNHDNKWVKM